MPDAIVQLPYSATTSGDLLDATQLVVGANTVKRERMVIGNDASTSVAIVTTSGALTVTKTTEVSLSSVIDIGSVNSVNNIVFGLIIASTVTGGIITGTTDRGLKVESTQPQTISSGLITLSSAIGVSSGLITLTGTNVVTNASSGLVQVLQSTGVWAISGSVSLTSGAILSSSLVTGIIGTSGGQAVVTTSGGMLVTFTNSVAGSTAINIVGSSNAIAPATSSGGLLVTFTNASAGGSTTVNIAGSTSDLLVISSAGVARGSINSSGGIQAPVTSSGGLRVSMAPTNVFWLLSTIGAPVPGVLSTVPCQVFGVNVAATGATVHWLQLHDLATAPAAGVASTVFRLMTPGAVGTPNPWESINGIRFGTGLAFTVNNGGTSTTATIHSVNALIEYSV